MLASHGLSSSDAAARLAECGPNQVDAGERVSAWSILLRQVANALTLVLVGAMALSFGVRDYVEGVVVTAVILLNVTLGFAQEWKAERTMANLRTLSSPTVRVVRDGEERTVKSVELVPGDLVLFAAGDLLQADVRIVSTSNVEVDEASLTGESLPVVKIVDAIQDDKAQLGPGDQFNLGFASTTVTKGRGKGIVVATGMNTQLGRIAAAMQARSSKPASSSDPAATGPVTRAWRLLCTKASAAWEPTAKFLGLRDGTPLQIRLNKFAYILLTIAVVCAIVVFAVAEFDIDDQVILYAIALGIGVIPESLVAVLTITFSVGAKRMAESNVIVRKLSALESLGGIDTVCSDKTGTLTTGKMVTSQIGFVLPPANMKDTTASQVNAAENQGVTVLKYGIERAAHAFMPVGRLHMPAHVHALTLAAALCNVAEIKAVPDSLGREGTWSATGDPTEIALQVFSMKLGMSKASLLAAPASEAETEKEEEAPGFVFAQEFPFDSTIKRATFMYHVTSNPEGGYALFTKGAVERVIERCSHTLTNGSAQEMKLTEGHKEAIMQLMERMASQGLRVLAFAHRHVSRSVGFDKALMASSGSGGGVKREDAETDLTFIGLAGIYDPPRPETPGAIEACHTAGVTVRMLTGDHIATARAIAREIGILKGDESASAVMPAHQFDSISDAEIDRLRELPLVLARCSPATKVKMIAAAQRRGQHLAMTGDGINDSPALKRAPIGIAMGSGTQIARDVADLILVDDGYASIVKGIAEGRTVFDNIQRFCIALLVANVGEVILLLVGLVFRDANRDSIFPLSPVAILFCNMVTASLPAIGLGLEKGDADIMLRPPHNVKAGVFSTQVISDMLFYGFTMGWTCLLAFIIMIYPVGDGVLAVECNERLAVGCEAVFQARAAVFTALILQNLFVAWELLSMDQSLFTISPHRRLARNPMLFWSVIFGICTIPICLYVPTFNTSVFRHSPLSGVGWAVALGMTITFILSIELWKALARRGYWPWLTRYTGGTVGRASKPKHGDVA
ncbi:potassium/sodium eff [Tilletiaria anomala UBC 951]|uniref:P-type Na(+) transporter n=1 Tax=Tilletiaria anomala (strain ATCC 24038 / CBS 436.72 / UBC 951) TaxID=1037660 RepID=A0A066WG47_TILAU|nr:potassium/sodium eff [Tilletiaria anomala UBC 951]KDN52932.1 potassium/sodium eff [Tilletiaria anomala UBC 951]